MSDLTNYGVDRVYKVTLANGKKYKLISDDPKFVKDFFSLKYDLKEIIDLRDPTDADYETLKTLG